MKTTQIGNLIWEIDSLGKLNFNNGDPIPMAMNLEEVLYYNEQNEPCCCYYDFNPDNKKYGLLYNWFAVIDERGITHGDFRIPTSEDVENSMNIIKEIDLNNGNEDLEETAISRNTLFTRTGMSPQPNGYLPIEDGENSIFQDLDCIAWYWTCNYMVDSSMACCFNFLGYDDGMFEPLEDSEIINFNYDFLTEHFGSMLSVRLVKDV
jgi:uncharacterized protein (TIGR02145 family)